MSYITQDDRMVERKLINLTTTTDDHPARNGLHCYQCAGCHDKFYGNERDLSQRDWHTTNCFKKPKPLKAPKMPGGDGENQSGTREQAIVAWQRNEIDGASFDNTLPVGQKYTWKARK